MLTGWKTPYVENIFDRAKNNFKSFTYYICKVKCYEDAASFEIVEQANLK